jgi:integrase
LQIQVRQNLAVKLRLQPLGAPDDTLIFPSEKGTPMGPENWLRRRMLGITSPVNFQILRRTFATNAQGHGNAKDVQAHLRHTDIATTLGIYTQPIDESVRKLVNAVADEVMSAEKPQPRVVSTRVQ